ncbi:GGDEF domain-containing protein [Roseateles koreensis]|uniref:GGDEF domain-containing protein n=1 Tax=Roseateles koreensis TaxID=2987526 RepID=A0ABT5KQQ2_9BURK|nr:GGDEF domain-containing protein [Roseateles koreensis]MDC8784795.1 GGDEF domain-containing protein [Roseateles koreensis]
MVKQNDLTTDHIRSQFLQQVWRGLLVLAVLGMPGSWLRAMQTGLQPVYIVHTLAALAIVTLYVRRNRLPHKFSATAAVLTMFAIGAGGLWTFGFYSAGLVWVIISCTICAVLFPRRISNGYIVGQMLFVLGVTAAFSQGWLAIAFDANEYIRKLQNWVGVLIGTSVGILTMVLGLRSYNESIVKLIDKISSQRDEIERQQALISHQANHDALTGLPTLRLARDRLEQAIAGANRRQCKAAVIFIDLDGFKAANDGHGHEAGDLVLKEVAERMRATLRAVDTAARQGGDEFVIILNEISTCEDAVQVASKLLEQIAQPIEYKGARIQVGASIGIAVCPDHSSNMTDLLHLADEAMYRVKKTGKNNLQLCDVPHPA